MSPRQKQLLDFVDATIRTTGLAPTFEEMRIELGMASRSNVFRIAHALVRMGRLRRTGDRVRGLTVVAHEQARELADVTTEALLDELRRRAAVAA